MLKKFLIIISLMTAFNLMGQLRSRNTNSDTQPISIIAKECNKDENGFCKVTTYGEGDGDAIDIDDPTINEDGMECIDDYTGEQRTRSMADFPHLTGYNLSDLIADIEYNNTQCSQLSVLQEDYQECRIIQHLDIYNINCRILCIPFYSEVATTTVFTNEEDYNNYAWDLNFNYYVPQGITKNNSGNLLISWYYSGTGGEYSKNSIIMKFSTLAPVKKIVKIYPLDDSFLTNPPHVGGIGYTYYKTGTFLNITNHDVIFVSDGYYEDEVTYVNIYEMTATSLIYRTKKKLDSSIKPDAMSYGNGYLWIGEFTADTTYPDCNKKLNGYKVTITTLPSLSITLGEQIIDPDLGPISSPNISVYLPKPKIQGIYPIPNSGGSRYSFYFTKSYSEYPSYTYQGTLDVNDVNNDGKINGTEGVCELNNEIWIPNEGASAKFSYWIDSVTDKSRELLKTNPVNNGNDKLFPAGAVLFKGNGIDSNFGTKLVLVMAQNKDGNFYYSLGKLNYYSNSYYIGEDITPSTLSGLIMYTEKPTTINPLGWQLPLNQKASVYVEDIKGLFLMNLDNTSGNSDDWALTEYQILFDDNKNTSLNTYSTPYQMIVNNENTELGDNIGDYKAFFTSFNTKHALNDILTTKTLYSGVKSNTSCYMETLYELYNNSNQCLLTNTFDYCFNTYIPTYLTTNEEDIFCRLVQQNANLLNDTLERLTPIEIDFCANVQDICD